MQEVISRRTLLKIQAATGAIVLLAPVRGMTDTFPSRPIRLVVPFPSGGPTDIVARPLAKLLSDSLRQSVFIDNRGGAGGTVGAANAAQAAPDGHTLFLGTVGTHAINPALYKKLPYDPVTSFTPLATAANAPVAIIVNADTNISSLAALVAKAKSQPNTLTYGSAGNGSPGHLAGAMFCSATGIKLQHVPYKGSAPAITDLLGGQIQAMFDPLQTALPHAQSGKLKILGLTSKQRASVLLDVPTVAESVAPDFEMIAWWAVYGPARLPPAIATALTESIQRVVQSADFERALTSLGVQPLNTPLAELQAKEITKWGAAVRTAGATLE